MKLTSEAVRAGMTGEIPKLEKRLVWRWYLCRPLVLLMMALGVLAAVIPWLWLLRWLVP